MNLVIVESPTKAKTISKFLGPDYKVESSYGHVRDLPRSTLGIDLEKNFEPKYVIPAKARKVVKQLKDVAKKSSEIILATDEDREGEAIAWHLAQILGLKQVKRIVFHEITKSAIEKALQNPRDLYMNLIDAQQARRILDRLVGYKLSPFLWKKVARGLSAGRVQSVAVRLIVERENEIRKFKAEEYWTVVAELLKDSEIAEFDLVKIDGQSLDKFAIRDKERAEQITADLKKSDFIINSVRRKEVAKNPPTPFTTSTMQQEAAKRLGYSAKKTMFIAQHLYENGHITYMRTDSVNLSAESVVAAKEWLEKEFGKEYALPSPRLFKSKSKLVQEAHEAIRPTSVFETPEKIELKDESERKLYRMIWQRFVASQMPAAKGALTSAEASAGIYTLRSNGQQIIFDGYLKVWPQKFSEKTLPSFDEKERLTARDIKPFQHFTEPAPRYSEATLIKALEEHGIGRPSTYAPTISVIQTRNYVQKEAGKFKPTEIGEAVNTMLTENFPKIVDLEFTAQVEEKLDNVAHGKEKWQELIKEFYEPFAKNLAEKYEAVVKTELFKDEKTDEKCEKCGKPMLVKYGRFGKFLACSGFPECKSTKQLPKDAPKPIGMKCPKCSEGEIVERRVNRGRARGKIFWGCGRYPKCDYASWTDPRNPPAPDKSESNATEIKPEEKPQEEIKTTT